MQSIYQQLSSDLQAKFKACKLLALDFDGVLTDNTLIHRENGEESVVRSRSDSQGIDHLNDAGLYDKANYENKNQKIDIIIVSRETNPVVSSVAKKIKIKCTQSKYKKFEAFQEEIKNRNLDATNVIFVGNDLNDIECIKAAGIGVAVADAYPEVIEVADYTTQHPGGRGVLREICELLIAAQAKEY